MYVLVDTSADITQLFRKTFYLTLVEFHVAQHIGVFGQIERRSATSTTHAPGSGSAAS